jgi:membrane-associated phospholipid phosphatase
MKKPISPSVRLASLISNVFNPFVIFAALILAIAFKADDTPGAAFKWAGILAAVSIAPVLLIAVYEVKKGKLDSIFSSLREQRTEMYLLALAVTAVDYGVMRFLGAPPLMLTGIATGVVATVIFMLINLRWKISIHAASGTGMVAAMVMMYGWVSVIGLVAVAAVGWSRVVLREHTVLQVTVGGLCAAATTALGFSFLGGV